VVGQNDGRLPHDAGELGTGNHAAAERSGANHHAENPGQLSDRDKLAALVRQFDESDEERGESTCPVLKSDQRRDLDHVDPHRDNAARRAAGQHGEEHRGGLSNRVPNQHHAHRAQQGEEGQEVAAAGSLGLAKPPDPQEQDQHDRDVEKQVPNAIHDAGETSSTCGP